MGQKVNPIGYRIGVNKDWDSKWYAEKDYSTKLINDIKIREYIEKNLKSASISKVIIERRKNKVELTIYTARPGVIIGRGGEDIEKLRKKISKLVNEDVYINIVEEKNPDLNAQLVADNIAMQIENRAPFRSVQKRAIRNTMKAGAKGIKTAVSGRLGGAEMARTEGYTEGTVPLHTIRADVDYATSEANTIYGKIGVKVWIYKDEILDTKKVKKGEIKNVNAKKN
ncbi:MAG: 30S ribosomal protein S3 [bacterium]|nr:30S ribosomal protein S3 [bacterium]